MPDGRGVLRRGLGAALCIAWVFAAAACRPREGVVASPFERVETGSERYDCSPEMDMDAIGLKINAPDVIPLEGDSPRAMVCGVRQLEGTLLAQIAPPINGSIIVVATDVESHEVLQSSLSGDDPMEPDPSPPDYAPEDLEGLVTTAWFNFDLFETPGIPRKPATYRVFVTLRDVSSNVVTVKVAPAP